MVAQEKVGRDKRECVGVGQGVGVGVGVWEGESVGVQLLLGTYFVHPPAHCTSCTPRFSLADMRFLSVVFAGLPGVPA